MFLKRACKHIDWRCSARCGSPCCYAHCWTAYYWLRGGIFGHNCTRISGTSLLIGPMGDAEYFCQAEIAPPHLRGTVMGCQQLMLTIGGACANCKIQCPLSDKYAKQDRGWLWLQLCSHVVPMAHASCLASCSRPYTSFWCLFSARIASVAGKTGRLGIGITGGAASSCRRAEFKFCPV